LCEFNGEVRQSKIEAAKRWFFLRSENITSKIHIQTLDDFIQTTLRGVLYRSPAKQRASKGPWCRREILIRQGRRHRTTTATQHAQTTKAMRDIRKRLF